MTNKVATKNKITGTPKKADKKKPSTTSVALIPSQPERRAEPPIDSRVVVTLETIRGETVIGDLLVAFPWTREVLVKRGLRLEAENAGDIYMSLEAFSAMNGLNSDNLVEDVVVVAKEPPLRPPVPPLVAPLAT